MQEILLKIMPAYNILAVIASIDLFVLKGIAINTMAKKAEVKNRWMAFVPFLSFIPLGKLIGACKVWGLKFKNIGVGMCITMAIQTVFSIILSLGSYIDSIADVFSLFGANASVTFTSDFFEIWYAITGGVYFKTVIPTYDLNLVVTWANIIVPIINIVLWLASAFFEIHLLLLLFKKYAPAKVMLFTILCIFVPEALGIILFILRNNEPFDYDAWRLERARRYTYYGGNNYGNTYNKTYNNPYSNPYGNPYSNPYNNPYTNPYNNQNASNKTAGNEDPFPEFGNGKNNANDNNNNPFGTDGFGQDNVN